MRRKGYILEKYHIKIAHQEFVNNYKDELYQCKNCGPGDDRSGSRAASGRGGNAYRGRRRRPCCW